MKTVLVIALAIASSNLVATGAEAKEDSSADVGSRPLSPDDLRRTAPALAEYSDKVLFGDLWKRTELSPRDRSLVTVSALVVGGHVEQLPFHLNRALDNGVTVSELQEVVTHLAFYTGWPDAMSATKVLRDVIGQRGVKANSAP